MVGLVDTGSHCDDCVTQVDLPFPVTLYGQEYTSAFASSNGNLQFSSSSSDNSHTCLPNPNFDSAILVYQGDLRTDGPGDGIFTAVNGSAPDRDYVIEWRTHYAQQQGTSNEEIIFHENSTTIDVVYGHNEDHGAGEVSGLQRDTGSAFAEFSCGDGVLTDAQTNRFVLG